MKVLAIYAILFVLVFTATYSLLPSLGIKKSSPPEHVIQVPFQEFPGTIGV